MSPRKKKEKTKSLAPVDPRALGLVAPPFPCADCDKPVADARLFCGQLCRDEAKYVRHYRARIADGTFIDADIREALAIRLAHILAGGYDARLRALSLELRREVFERDGYRCRKCGGQGTEVDHVLGPGSELSNLQLLCSACHREKTRRSFQRISRKTHPDQWATAVALDARVQAAEPSRICDDGEWDRLWRTIATARRRAAARMA